jgi:diketogulonate reductase-like aldo/keto reductase
MSKFNRYSRSSTGLSDSLEPSLDYVPIMGIGTFRLNIIKKSLERDSLKQIPRQLNSDESQCPVYDSVLRALLASPMIATQVKPTFHIDTAPSYESEEGVGRAVQTFLKITDMSRNRVKITTKISKPSLVNGHYNDIKDSVINSLFVMKLDYVDEIVIHQPISMELSIINWIHLVRFKQDNPKSVIRIGVSNYNSEHLEQIILWVKRDNSMSGYDGISVDLIRVMPVINQIEVTPFLKRDKLIKFCKDLSIDIVAHSPLAKGEKFTKVYDTLNIRKKKKPKDMHNPILNKIANSRNITEAQVMLYWAMFKGYRVIPRSNSDDHIKENSQTFFNVLTDYNPLCLTDIDLLDSIEDEDQHSTHPQYLKS